ncbi:hypothetical protein LTR17_008717 [Elasticomyces elasticus]|nr:hypothetical protein LTR17_008717 [Elasticomyces elasticus]
MSVITVTEIASLSAERCHVQVEYQCSKYECNIVLPGSDQEEEFRWYLEDYVLEDPFEHARSFRAKQGMEEYAKSLAASLRLQDLIAQIGCCKILLEVAGSQASDSVMHRVHWELLEQHTLWPDRLPDLCITVARIIQPKVWKTETPPNEPPHEEAYFRHRRKILVVVSRSLSYDEPPHRDITTQILQRSRAGNMKFPERETVVEIVRPCTYEAFDACLQDGPIEVVHFDMHGVEKDQQFFLRFFRLAANSGTLVADDVPALKIAKALGRQNVPFAILNACRSAKEFGIEQSIAQVLVAEGLRAAGAMAYNVLGIAARAFTTAFYESYLCQNGNFTTSFGLARLALGRCNIRRTNYDSEVTLHDCVVPRLYVSNIPGNRMLLSRVAKVDTFEASEGEATLGRDTDIFRLETFLLLQETRNLALLKGPPGVGKTALLRHLAHWWEDTNLVAKTLLLNVMGGTPDAERFDLFKALTLFTGAKDREETVRCLKHKRYLVMVDAVETLNHEQIAPMRWLMKRKSSDERVGEFWLSLFVFASRDDGTFDRYGFEHELSGLSEWSAVLLAARLMHIHDLSLQTTGDLQYLRRIVGLVDYNPLVIELLAYDMSVKRIPPKEYFARLLLGNEIALDESTSPRSFLELGPMIHSILFSVAAENRGEASLSLFASVPFWKVLPMGRLSVFTNLFRHYSATQSSAQSGVDQITSEMATSVLLFQQGQDGLSSETHNIKDEALIKLVKAYKEAGFLKRIRGQDDVLAIHPLVPVFLRTLSGIYQYNHHDALRQALPRFYMVLLLAPSSKVDVKAKNTQPEFFNLLAAATCLIEEAPDGMWACHLWSLFLVLKDGDQADPSRSLLILDACCRAFYILRSRLATPPQALSDLYRDLTSSQQSQLGLTPLAVVERLEARKLAMTRVVTEISASALLCLATIVAQNTSLRAASEDELAFTAALREFSPLENPESVLARDDPKHWEHTSAALTRLCSTRAIRQHDEAPGKSTLTWLDEAKQYLSADTKFPLMFVHHDEMSRLMRLKNYEKARYGAVSMLKDLTSSGGRTADQASIHVQLCELALLEEDWVAAEHHIDAALDLERDADLTRLIELHGWRVRVLEGPYSTTPTAAVQAADTLYSELTAEDVPAQLESQVALILASLKMSRRIDGRFSSIFLIIRAAKAHYTESTMAYYNARFIAAIVNDCHLQQNFWSQPCTGDNFQVLCTWLLYRYLVIDLLEARDWISRDEDNKGLISLWCEMETWLFSNDTSHAKRVHFPRRDWKKDVSLPIVAYLMHKLT